MDLRQLDRALGLFAVLEPTHFYAHFAQVFIVIAEHEPCTLKFVEDKLNLSPSAVSRTVHALGDQHRKGRPGFDLVTTEKDPEEGRRFIAFLTPKGKALKRQLLEL
jgi:DNA-binding MarR family transcriptional regulator